MRKGLGLGLGKGYKNLIHIDSYIHSLSAKGVKTKNKLYAREVVVRFHVYSFDELPKEAKEKALEEYRYINVDFPDWYHDDGLLELSEKEMKEAKIKMSKNWYDTKGNIKGEYPAYTGLFKWKDLAFDLDRYMYLQFIDLKVTDDEVFRKFLHIPKRLWDKVDYHFENSGRETNTRLEFEANEMDVEFTPNEEEILNNAGKIFAEKVKEAHKSIRKNYEYLLSDEAIEETFKANEYEFTEDGKIH